MISNSNEDYKGKYLIHSTTFKNNSAGLGGSLYIDGGDLNIQDSQALQE